MRELLEELEHNRQVNLENGLENRVDIDYIIERLQDINICEEYFKNEIYSNIESMINDDYLSEEQIEKLAKLEDKDIQDIVDNLMYDDYRNSQINEDIQDMLNELVEEE